MTCTHVSSVRMLKCSIHIIQSYIWIYMWGLTLQWQPLAATTLLVISILLATNFRYIGTTQLHACCNHLPCPLSGLSTDESTLCILLIIILECKNLYIPCNIHQCVYLILVNYSQYMLIQSANYWIGMQVILSSTFQISHVSRIWHQTHTFDHLETRAVTSAPCG